jgi:hypothetical protein
MSYGGCSRILKCTSHQHCQIDKVIGAKHGKSSSSSGPTSAIIGIGQNNLSEQKWATIVQDNLEYTRCVRISRGKCVQHGSKVFARVSC